MHLRYMVFLIVATMLVLPAHAQSTSDSSPSDDIQTANVDLAASELVGAKASGLQFDAQQRLTPATGDGVATSGVVQAPIAFTAVGPRWNGDAVEQGVSVEIRTSTDGATWSAWLPTGHPTPVRDVNEKTGEPNPFAGDVAADPVITEPGSRYAQIRVRLASGETVPALGRVSLYFMNVQRDFEKPSAAEHATQSMDAGDDVAPKAATPAIYSRSQWGAEPPKYGYSYHTATHLAFHHTYSGYNAYSWSECANAVYSVQHYHQNVNGWNDIGYHYLVCRSGYIFQGREDNYNANDVYGAHDGYNNGSVAVSAIGNFHPGTTAPTNSVTTQLKDGIADVFAWIADRRGIDVWDQSYYAGYGGTMWNVYGHREVGQTACPGDYLYNEKLDIVDRTASRMTTLKASDRQTVAESGARVGAYPNPFQETATVRVELQQSADVTLRVFDVLGRQVMERDAGRLLPGTHELSVNGSDWAPGTYLYRVEAGEQVTTGAMRLVR